MEYLKSLCYVCCTQHPFNVSCSFWFHCSNNNSSEFFWSLSSWRSNKKCVYARCEEKNVNQKMFFSGFVMEALVRWFFFLTLPSSSFFSFRKITDMTADFAFFACVSQSKRSTFSRSNQTPNLQGFASRARDGKLFKILHLSRVQQVHKTRNCLLCGNMKLNNKYIKVRCRQETARMWNKEAALAWLGFERREK